MTQHSVEIGLLLGGQPFQHVTQVDLRIKVVDLGRLDERHNIGRAVSIAKHVIKHLSRLCDDDFDEGAIMAESILKSADIERLEVPAVIAAFMVSKIDDPNAVEFWVHRDSSTVFLVKPRENYRVVEMAIKTSIAGFLFENSEASP